MLRRLRKPAGIEAGIEAEIDALAARRAALEGQLAEAKAASEKAAATIRAHLVEGDLSDSAAIARAETANREAAGRIATLEDALRSVAERLLDAERRQTEALDRAKREAVAGELEAGAAAVDELAAEVGRAAGALAKATAGLVAALKHAPHLTSRENGRPLPADRLASVIVADALADAAPFLFRTVRLPGVTEATIALHRGVFGRAGVRFEAAPADFVQPLPAGEIASVVASGPMRSLATSIRVGDAAPALPSPAPEPMPTFRPRVKGAALLFMTAGAKWLTVAGGRFSSVGRGVQRLPIPVAEAALRAGIAEDMAGARGKELAEQARALRAAQKGQAASPLDTVPIAQCHDLGLFDIEGMADADIDQQRRDWLAERGRAA